MTYVEAKRTPITAQDAVAGFIKACHELWNTTKPETVAVLTAQSALESARWAAMWNFNPSNIKHGVSRVGLYTCIKLNEVEMRDGKRTTIWYDPVLGELLGKNGPARYPDKPYTLPPGHPQCRMRAFETFAAGVKDKLTFLNRPHYAGAKRAALAGDPAAYAVECKAAGYFTADLAPYKRSVVSLFKTYLPLAQGIVPTPKPLLPTEEDQLCRDMAACARGEIPDWLRRHLDYLIASTMQLNWDDLTKSRDEAVRED